MAEVLGGMTTFLFANVLVSGINIVGGNGTMSRRNRCQDAAS